MKIIRNLQELKSVLNDWRKEFKIGFVPTMGALHSGHISLIKESKLQCQKTVCSIFVNPTQFNDKKDLERYPRTEKEDVKLLIAADCDIVFIPEVNEMYPHKDERTFDFGHLDKVLDGAARPGHFNGVAQIVSKLFDAVKPDKAFFGIKDYQQVLIIKELVRQMKTNIEIVACPIMREKDGLAMSSRNTLLSTQERKLASVIPKVMQSIPSLKAAGYSFSEVKKQVASKFSGNGYRLDYFIISDANSLIEDEDFTDSHQQVVLIACFIGHIRLIDNMLL
ncbi:MAG: pantoate--beta-alanine ligase [Bacteroidota bacterium]